MKHFFLIIIIMFRKYKAFLLSFLVHAAVVSGAIVLYEKNERPVVSEKRYIISLSHCIEKPDIPTPQNISQPVKQKIKPKPPKVKPKKVKKKEPVKKPEKRVIRKVTPKKQKKTVKPEKKDVPVPVQIAAVELKPLVMPVSAPVQQKSRPVEMAKLTVPVSQPSLEESYLDEHLELIATLLRENLYYPRIARKRGITGEVIIAFDLTTGGEIKNSVVVSGEYAVLNRAAITTLQRLAGEFPHPQEHLSLQVPIRYQLR